MAKRVALAWLGIGSPVILLTFLWAGPWSELLFCLLAASFPVALIVVGASRKGSLGPTLVPLFVLLLLLVGSMLGMLYLRGRVVDGPWIGGLPLAAALQLYGIWLAPTGLVVLTYALTFKSLGLRERDLERIAAIRSPPAATEGDG
jgi:hypothetical protein